MSLTLRDPGLTEVVIDQHISTLVIKGFKGSSDGETPQDIRRI